MVSPVELLLAPLLKGYINNTDLSSKIASLFAVFPLFTCPLDLPV
jgi:hypothetical protein